MTALEARRLVAVAVASCPTQGGKLDRAQLKDMGDAWAALLADITYADASAALKRYLATSHWLPAPAQLRAIVSEAQHGRRRPGGDAWGDVLGAVGRYGRDRRPTFVDELVGRCVDALGWRELCDSENQTADRARFIELYDRIATEAAQDRSVATLPGVARPALIGPSGRVGEPHRLDIKVALPAGDDDEEGN